MPKYRHLERGEIIKATDEYDACNDGWRDDPVWKPVKTRIGQPAPDPAYPSHTTYRRRLTLWERFVESKWAMPVLILLALALSVVYGLS